MSFVSSARISPHSGTEPKKMYHGLYQASVVNNNDPLVQKRVQLKVPQVLGVAVSNWANPITSSVTLPSTGATVYIMFLGGDVNHPVYFN